MRRILFFCLCIAFISSCTSDPTIGANGHDSLNDTANTNFASNDTFRVDTGNGAGIYYDCSVLNQRIPSDTAQNQIRNDIAKLMHCGIDSFDFLYVVPNLFPGWISEMRVSGNKKATYADFVNHVNEFKSTEAYPQLHIRVETLDSLRSTKYDATKLYASKSVLGRLGFTEPEWQMFSGFAKSYPIPKGRFTWGDMLEAFDKYKPR